MDHKKRYFIFYCIAFVVYGSIITALGPIIPYFSKETGQPETYYSFLFLSRAAGYIAGGSFIKILMDKFSLHHILAGIMIFGGFCFMISTFSLTFWNLTISIFFGAACCCMLNITCNVCVMQLFKKDSQDFWIQLLHLLFGVGGFVGPIITSFTGARSYFYLGLILLLLCPLFLYTQSPQNRRQNFTTEIARPISRKIQIMICVVYLLYIGQQVGFGSWVSSYAVMEGIADAQEATYASIVFWTTNTVFRIILLYVGSKVSTRLKVLMTGMVLGCIINLIAALTSHEWFAAYIGSFMNGAFLSSLFALFLTLPLQFGYKLSKHNTANFMMSATMGQGALAMPIGVLMGLFGPWMLFFTELTFAVISLVIILRVISNFETETKSTYLMPKQQQLRVSDHLFDVYPEN